MFGSEPSILAAIGQAVALVLLDGDGRVSHWSEGAVRLWGWAPEECIGRRWVEIGFITDSVRESQALALMDDVASGASRDFEWTAKRADGGAVRLHSTAAPLLDEHGVVAGMVCLSFDLSGREGFEQALVRAALHDQLTRLPGRSLFVHEVVLALADRRGTHRTVVLFVDLDRFKRVNDEHGHAAGDEVLVTIADRLRSAVRDGDVVARLGGDEFGVLLRIVGGSEVAADLTDRIGRLLAEPVQVGDVLVEVGASIGVAAAGPDDDAEDVLARADAAMYRAKRAEPFDRVQDRAQITS